MTPRLLIVDGDSATRPALVALLRERGFSAETAESEDAALAKVREQEFDVVLSDVELPGAGVEIVGLLRRLRPETPIVALTAHAEAAREALRSGALEHLVRPFESETALCSIERALERRALEQENRDLRRALDRTRAFGDLIGTSPAMRDLFAAIRRAASSRANVLITGERGTGKELVARALHVTGPRAERPFVPVRCGSPDEDRLESELFGQSARGARASTARNGLFARANGGTLFLDAVDELGSALQEKLLRTLQNGQIHPVGTATPVAVDVRVVAASSDDLERGIEEGRFRAELLHRLGAVHLHIPPLRERPDDVLELAEAFLRRHDPSGRHTLSSAALRRLATCLWRGNARELENVIERALARCAADVIEAQDLPLAAGAPESGRSGDDAFLEAAARRQLSLRKLEERYIDEVLRMTGGNKVRAAQILGIDRKTLYRRAERRRALASRTQSPVV
ncbi:MAG TPA: sigma-54 dependent transcriptional regulator [Myxococcota bacterium]|nr:sigma-54 dependent transcriptional regulator [Myxococcota bacterium]